MAYVPAGAGLHRFTDAADGETYLAVHGGLGNAPRVFAAFDQPDLKAVMAATVTAPEHWTVIGNGRARAARRRPLGAGPDPAHVHLPVRRGSRPVRQHRR